MAKNVTWRFTVTGSGEFPYDMLRYDRCWPRIEEDTRHLRSHRTMQNTRTVHMEGLRPPTTARWASFGWEAATT